MENTCYRCRGLKRDEVDFLVYVALHIRDSHRLLEKELCLDHDIVWHIYYDYDFSGNEVELTYQLLLHWQKKYGSCYSKLYHSCKNVGVSNETLRHIFIHK